MFVSVGAYAGMLTNTGPLIMSAGPATFSTDGSLTGSGGRTFVEGLAPHAIRKSGYVYAVSFDVKTSATEALKIKCFTTNSAGVFSLLREESTAVQTWPTGSNYYVLPVPLKIIEGGYPGIYSVNVDLWATGSTANSTYYKDGDVTGNANTLSGLASELCLQFWTEAPVIAYTGDSIIAGHNTSYSFMPFLDSGGIGGNIYGSIPYCASTNGESPFTYCNYGSGGKTFFWVNTTAFPYITNDAPSALWIHSGVNDVSQGFTWADILTNLTAIRAKWPVNKPLWMSEILPWTAGNDTQAATIRQYNTNLAAWALTNSCTIATLHDAFGQIRVSTGFLDDLKTSYNAGDGVHLSQAGVSNYVYMMSTDYLTNSLWIAPTLLSTTTLSIGTAIFGP